MLEKVEIRSRRPVPREEYTIKVYTRCLNQERREVCMYVCVSED